MALVMPFLLFMIMAIVDLSRAYDTKLQLSQAAREGVRLVSMQSTSNLATRVQQAAPALDSVTILPPTYTYMVGPTVTPWPGDCSTTGASGVVNASVTVTTSFTWITGLSAMSGFLGQGTFPTPTTQSATGVMQCA
jgi:Flp pilus assembly protein TadG